MKQMKFKCTLLSDIILSQTSSSEGNQNSLNFIPGNNFLGIAASRLYDKLDATDALAIFHSGQVRFGDANPSNEGKNRGLKVPASMFYPKLKKASEECYIHHLIENPDAESIKGLQLKQCREGFYAFSKNVGEPITFDKNFAIKSAYDSKQRRSEDEKLFCYESLPKGLVLFFEVESELDDTLNDKIKDALVGIRHIGHSRTAQYGLVSIEESDYTEVVSTQQLNTLKNHKQYATAYADGRLVFLDENGEFTFQPSAQELGFGEGDRIDWSKSQVRVFQYSPWNGKRHTYDTDRCGIEKGSVFVVECSTCPETSQYVGYYKNEGFGRVIYNPDFLKGNAIGDGKAQYTLKEKDSQESDSPSVEIPTDSVLFQFLQKKKDIKEAENSAYVLANQFVDANERYFSGEQFASQWGSIRSLAMISSNPDALIKNVETFLNHGVAKAKWDEQNRTKVLLDFMNTHKNHNLQDTMINLASEMAKKCRKEKK